MTYSNDATRSDLQTEGSASAVSWGAIAAGAVANASLTLVLLALGAGLGFAIVSPWGDSGVSATTFKIGAGIYLIVVAMIASGVGGHIAGRLRTRWTGVHSDEVFFRDTAHGFLAWAFAAIVGVAVLSAPANTIAGGVASGASRAATQMASSGPSDKYVDALLRADGANAPAPSDANATRMELTRLFVASARSGGAIGDADRAYVAKLVAARTGLSEADAAKRVNDVSTQAKADIDAARKQASQLALWLTASLVIGAFASSLAATEGGRARDTDWTTRR